MIVIAALLFYLVLVWGGIKFFHQVHTWDEQALKMFEGEQLRWETKNVEQSKGRKKQSKTPAGESLSGSRIANVLSRKVKFEG
jgi:hypothetical protein